jgi:23S rRNA pseudoU1915 N3-methylase RlmH
VGQPSWEDRAASVLLRFLVGYGEADLKFRPVERRDEKGRVVRGFQVFRAYGGVEAPVGELWIGEPAYFKASKEELKRLVEEARKTAPDLSGIKKIWQTLEWLNTDVSFDGRQIKGGTAHLWQLKWYIALFGEGKTSGGRVNVTEEGVKPYVQMRWHREDLDRIIAAESDELMPLLGRAVKSWRELVDAINWSWVLKRVEELVDELKPWIGPERMSDAEREGLMRRMLGELALLVHFAEARRGMDDGRWREERAKKLAKAVEALSGGRIKGDHANELAKLIIRYAEGHKKDAKKRIKNLAKEVGVSREEVWNIVEFVLSDMYCLAKDCADDRIVRKFVAPALELIMLDKALNNEFNREEALLIFGEMYATALAGDGHVGPREVVLVVGGVLGGGAALLRLAALHLFNQLLSDELKFDMRVYVERGRYYDIAAYGENAARFMHLLAVSAPSAGGEYLSPKFKKFVEAARIEVRVDNIRQTKKGRVAADLTISKGDIMIKYNVYLRKDHILLVFHSADRSRVELAARLLRHAGVSAEVRKEGGRDVWYVYASTDMLAAGREELRSAIAEVVKKAVEKGWVDAGKAERWLEKLEEGRVLKEGWPKYNVKLDHHGALVVSFGSTNPDSIEREAQRLRKMGLVEDKHFTVKMPEEGHEGYVRILKKGLAYAAWLSVHGEDEDRRKLAAAFVELILQRAEEACGGAEQCAVYEKAKEIVEEGKAWRSVKLEGFEKKVEVNGKTYIVKVIGGEAVEEDIGGKTLLRIRITAEVGRVEGGHIVDRVVREYEITYGRYHKNAAVGYAYASADVPGGREADAERYSALIKALTGRKPNIRRRKDGKIEIKCYEGHLEGFMRYKELADAIERWLEETGR